MERGLFEDGRCCPIYEIAGVYRQKLGVTAQADSPWGSYTDLHLVFQRDRLHNRPEVMIAIGAAIEDAKDEIDLGGGMNRN